MGYETKLIIGTLTHMKCFKDKNDCDLVLEIASINLCKSCFYDTWLNKERDTHRVYFYGSDGNTEISTDRYGSQLFSIDPKEVLKLMEQENKPEPYRRYNAAIPMLKSLIKDFKGEKLTCILYGY